MMDIKEYLKSLDILTGLDDEAITHIASRSWIEDYSSGEFLLDVGDPVNNLGVPISGSVLMQISMEPKKEIVLGKGEPFNLMSLVTGEPAIASITAVSQTRVLHVPFDVLSEEMAKAPAASQRLARILTTRLIRREEDRTGQMVTGPGPGDSRATKREDGRSRPVLVLNLGSSSIKYALYRGKNCYVQGIVERIGRKDATLSHSSVRGTFPEMKEPLGLVDHEKALATVMRIIVKKSDGAIERIEDLAAVGHRVVHGGEKFTESTVVTTQVKHEIDKLSSLAPLHNPVNLKGIELCERLMPPSVAQIAVFDTSFHMTMPEHAYRYAIPRDLADENQLRRFGFHGTSHKYVSEAAASYLGVKGKSVKLITCHLGNGCSITAVEHGRSIDTSMGLTPLEGLLMGTRCGDVDPGLMLHLLGLGYTQASLDELLNKKSGLLGISELSGDMVDLCTAAENGHAGALLAIQTFCYRVRKYIGAYTAVMNGVDAIIFTGGIGENSELIRSRICNGLSFLGVEADAERNADAAKNREIISEISSEDSRVKVLVVPTDEQWMIARETIGALNRTGVAAVLDARRETPIPVGVSAHHVHLTREDTEALFGKGFKLKPERELKQKGYFACKETVDLIGPKGEVKRVRVLGPEREASQVEISKTDEFKLGIDAPIRESGDIKNTPGLILRAGDREITLKEGVICALRHIHASPEDALAMGIRDKDVVRAAVSGERSVVFGDILVRVHPGWSLELHLDTDEANAAQVESGMTAVIESIQRRAINVF